MRIIFSVGLTDVKLLDLTEKITNQSILRRLAIRGLGKKFHEVDRFVANYSNDITTAACNMLTEWRNTQPDLETAYTSICEALKNANLNALIDELQ